MSSMTRKAANAKMTPPNAAVFVSVINEDAAAEKGNIARSSAVSTEANVL
jgi:hypothetical protein